MLLRMTARRRVLRFTNLRTRFAAAVLSAMIHALLLLALPGSYPNGDCPPPNRRHAAASRTTAAARTRRTRRRSSGICVFRPVDSASDPASRKTGGS